MQDVPISTARFFPIVGPQERVTVEQAKSNLSGNLTWTPFGDEMDSLECFDRYGYGDSPQGRYVIEGETC